MAIQREVLLSRSEEISLALVQAPGPAHTIEPAPYARICLNLGATYSFDVEGQGGIETCVCRRHSLLIIPPDTTWVHRSTLPTPVQRHHKQARLASFRFSARLLTDAALALNLPPSARRLRHEVVATDEVLRSLAQSLLFDLRALSPDGPRATEHLALAFMARVLLRRKTSSAPDRGVAMALVQNHISQNLQSAIPLEELAKIASMSLFHFCRVFRNFTGMTPHQYVLKQRVEQAKRLIWTGKDRRGAQISMLDIALTCGFNSPSHFAAQFKKHVGQTPTQWMRAN